MQSNNTNVTRFKCITPHSSLYANVCWHI